MAPGHRRTKSSGPVPPAQTLVIDNGAHTMKAGFSAQDVETPKPRIIPNCMARDREKNVYIGSQLDKCKDFGEIVFRRPVEKGYLVNWEAEREIWDREFFDDKAPLHCDPKETGLILTEALNALPVLQTNCDQVVFEEFGFSSYLRCPAPTLNAYHDVQGIFKTPSRPPTTSLPAEIILLIDSGYSHTTITPLIQGRPLQSAIRRLDIGGKLLTNHLTRLLSLRQYDMRNDTYLVNEIKEAACYVSLDFQGDMERTWKGPKGDRREDFAKAGGIAKDYVLPDYHGRSKGFMRDHDPQRAGNLKKMQAGNPAEVAEDFVTLRNERFTVPELLFNPSDIGIRQPGIAQLVLESLSGLPFGLWPGLLANILVVGGNANIEGFVQRLRMEIRALAPAECIVRVQKPIDPIIATWEGGAELAKDTQRLAKMSVTKAEYEELGGGWVARKFSGLSQ